MRQFFICSTFILVTVFCCLAFSGASMFDQGGLAASVKRGREVYNQTCLSCHQADGAGVPRMTPTLHKTPWVEGDKKRLIAIVLNGLTGEIEVDGEFYNNTMPPFNTLTDQQVADVLTYVRNSFSNKASMVTAKEVKAVRAAKKN